MLHNQQPALETPHGNRQRIQELLIFEFKNKSI
jgi:hypothetical protein